MSEDMIDYRVAELMASRLCHDLISPIGAVNNGLELLEEEPDEELTAEALRLAGNSARQASVVLQFYRVAFGRAGSGEGMAEAEVRRLAEAYLAHRRCTLAWPAAALPNAEGVEVKKLLLNLLALGGEALPRGGELTFTLSTPPAGIEGAPRIELSAKGRGAGLREEVLAALYLDAPVSELTPRSVQAYIAARLARRSGAELRAISIAEGSLALIAAPLEA